MSVMHVDTFIRTCLARNKGSICSIQKKPVKTGFFYRCIDEDTRLDTAMVLGKMRLSYIRERTIFLCNFRIRSKKEVCKETAGGNSPCCFFFNNFYCLFSRKPLKILQEFCHFRSVFGNIHGNSIRIIRKMEFGSLRKLRIVEGTGRKGKFLSR